VGGQIDDGNLIADLFDKGIAPGDPKIEGMYIITLSGHIRHDLRINPKFRVDKTQNFRFRVQP
jgi:hypothetical protein